MRGCFPLNNKWMDDAVYLLKSLLDISRDI